MLCNLQRDANKIHITCTSLFVEAVSMWMSTLIELAVGALGAKGAGLKGGYGARKRLNRGEWEACV